MIKKQPLEIPTAEEAIEDIAESGMLTLKSPIVDNSTFFLDGATYQKMDGEYQDTSNLGLVNPQFISIFNVPPKQAVNDVALAKSRVTSGGGSSTHERPWV